MAGFKESIKNLFKGKKGSKSQKNDSSSLYDRYGVSEESFQSNPFYEREENEFVNPLYEIDQKKDEELVPKVNLLQTVAGMPTRASIEQMTGELDIKKLEKHKEFGNALNALESYQRLMQQEHTITMNLWKGARRYVTMKESTDLDIGAELADQAFDEMKNFVLYAQKAVNKANGLFARRSSTVQKLVPIFASMLVQAYSVLPKLAHLEYEVAPYVMATDKETFTYEEILNHQVTSGRADGYAMNDSEGNNGAFVLNPKEVFKKLKNTEDEEVDLKNEILEMRNRETVKARMKMKLPMFPAGCLKAQLAETVGEKGADELKKNAETIADDYIAQLRLLMRVLEDTEESFEGGEHDRAEVHDKQAEYSGFGVCSTV